VESLVPDWTAIGEALGRSLKITPGLWENDGLNRRIGIAQLGNRFRRDGRLSLPVLQISLHPDLAAGLPRRLVTR
jgi:hypothetical protein